MAIPRGRFGWDFTNKDEADAKKIVKSWNGQVRVGDQDIGCNNNNLYLSYTWKHTGAFTLPQVDSNSGQIWLTLASPYSMGVTLGPKEYTAYFPYTEGNDHYYNYKANENNNNNGTVGWQYYFGGGVYGFGYGYYYANLYNATKMYYQSYGSGTYTINRCHQEDFSKFGTTSVIVTKGTQISTGKASTAILFAKNSQDSRNWSAFHFWIWNPEISTWITGEIQGIQQSLIDSSHVLITPFEANGYSFPDIYFADSSSNHALREYCSAEQLREYKYGIKKVTFSGTTYYVPITHSDNTVILIKKKPDDITIDH